MQAYTSAPKVGSSKTVREIVEGYLADRKRKVSAPKTLENYCNHIINILGHVYHDDLSRQDIERYSDQRMNDGKSPSTVIRALSVLRASIYWAERENWVTRGFRFKMPVSPAGPRERWITKEEARALLNACKKRGMHLYTFTLLALSTAARKSAITDLKWDAVDFKRKLIDFSAVKGGRNKRRSVVPMNDELFEHMKIMRNFSVSDHVIEYAGKQVTTIYKVFKRAANDAGVKDVSPHIMRHTAATWMIMDGVPLREIARFLGDTEEMVEKVYGKHSPQYLQRASKALNIGGK